MEKHQTLGPRRWVSKQQPATRAKARRDSDRPVDPPWDTPRTPEDLQGLLEKEFDLRIAGGEKESGHHSPLDYLTHTFFEGCGSMENLLAQSRPGQRPTTGPGDCVIWANRGGGKTFLGAVATMLDLVYKPGIEIRILGGSMDQSRRMHAHLRRLFAHEELAKRVEGRITDRRIRLYNGSEVELLAQSQVSVRGTHVQKLRCDEVELFDIEVWEAAQLTTRAKTVEMAEVGPINVRAWVECLSTMHQPHGLMHDLVEQAREGKRRLFKWGVADVLDTCKHGRECNGGESQTPPEPTGQTPTPEPDCPLLQECQKRAKGDDFVPGHIDIEDAIVMKSRVSVSTWEAEMLCLRPSRSTAVVPEFDKKLHVVDQLPDRPEKLEWFGGMDFGVSAPTIILWAALDQSGVLWVADEYERRGGLMEDHVRALQNSPRPRPRWIGADPAGGSRDSQTGNSDIAVLQRAGFAVRAGRSQIFEGLSLLRARLRPAFSTGGGPRLFVLSRCRRLIESLECYHYDPKHPDQGAPIKDGHDHAIDALRYLLIHLDRRFASAEGRYA